MFSVPLQVLGNALLLDPDLTWCMENVPWHANLAEELKSFDAQIEALGGKRYIIDMSAFSPQTRTRWVWSNVDLSDAEHQVRAFDWEDCLDPGRLPPLDEDGEPRKLAPTIMATTRTHSERKQTGYVRDQRSQQLVPMRIEEKEALQGMPRGFTKGSADKPLSEEQRQLACGNAIPHAFLSYFFRKVLPCRKDPSAEHSQEWYRRHIATEDAEPKRQEVRAAKALSDEKGPEKKVLDEEEFNRIAREVHKHMHMGGTATLKFLKTYFNLKDISKAREKLIEIAKNEGAGDGSGGVTGFGLQPTRIGRATDSMFWVPLNHNISWVFKSF